MKVTTQDSSAIVSTIKYILDELLRDLHSPSISTNTYNGTRHMFYNSSTKWNSEYSIEKSKASSPEDEYSIMLVSEFVVDDGEDAVSDFYITSHTLKPINRNTVIHESNESQDQQQEFEGIDITTEIDDENEGIDNTTEIAAEEEGIDNTTEITAADESIDNATEIADENEGFDNTTDITDEDKDIDFIV